MKNQVKLISRNNQGASVEFKGATKAEALRNFKAEYSVKGWKLEYVDTYGKSI